MKRFLSPLLTLLIVLGLMLSTASSAAMRSAQAIAGAGQQTIVICGASGAETVTLDRHGQPVAPSPATCRHCADCMVPALVLPVPVQTLPMVAQRAARRTRPVARSLNPTPVTPSRARGPPATKGL